MKLESMKDGVESLWSSLTEGWQHLRHSAATALTRFRPGAEAHMPGEGEVTDAAYQPGRSWALLGGDVFEDADKVVVRLEAPGMEKDDFVVEVFDGHLVISGEKHFQRESTEGRWQMVQCAYGLFRREIPLPVAVDRTQAAASYRNGVLRVELKKKVGAEAASHRVAVD